MKIHPLTTKAVVLQLLTRGPNYSMGLIEMASDVTKGEFVTYQDNMKIALADLSKDNLIERCAGCQPRKAGKQRVYYKLTVFGRKMVHDHRQLVARIFS
jgi:DNA-binding PadR family transcriptional regulator